MRTQLLAALEESLAATPDPAEVLFAIHTGIERRNRRIRCYRAGFAIMAIVFVLIVSLAAASALPDRDPALAGIPVGEWKNTIRPTWLPAGMNAQEFSATATGESIFYWSSESSLSIFVDNVDRSRTLDRPVWRRIEIDGRRAWEWSIPTQTTLVSELPSGRWVSIELSRTRPNATDAQPDVREEATHVARSLQETGDLRLRTRFAPTYLPTGQRVIGVETNIFTPAGFGTIVCAAGSLQVKGQPDYQFFGKTAVYHRTLDEGPGLRISMSNVAVNTALSERIPDIQGRAAYRSVGGGSVSVVDFHGSTLTVDATHDGAWLIGDAPLPPGLTPLAELIKVAEGVRWIG